jgi:hypothetical protein
VFRINKNLNMNNIKERGGIGLYTEVEPILEAQIAPLPAGGDMLDWPCLM